MVSRPCIVSSMVAPTEQTKKRSEFNKLLKLAALGYTTGVSVNSSRYSQFLPHQPSLPLNHQSVESIARISSAIRFAVEVISRCLAK